MRSSATVESASVGVWRLLTCRKKGTFSFVVELGGIIPFRCMPVTDSWRASGSTVFLTLARMEQNTDRRSTIILATSTCRCLDGDYDACNYLVAPEGDFDEDGVDIIFGLPGKQQPIDVGRYRRPAIRPSRLPRSQGQQRDIVISLTRAG